MYKTHFEYHMSQVRAKEAGLLRPHNDHTRTRTNTDSAKVAVEAP